MSAFNQQQLKLIEALFDEALETKPEDLDSWLLSKCPSDDALRTHLRKLIIASDALRTADLRGKVAPFDAEELKIESSKIGDRIGPYTLIEPLGKGGFGVVWLAERREPMVQRVALKIMKTAQSSPAKLALFEQERQALAMMDHPNIAKILDGGVTPEGQPYFVMEFVNGEPITDFADRRKLTIRQRLQLFVQVCEAFQHAHSRGIIHRDIKPSNILVALTDEHVATDKDSVQGLRVKVIDFGLVKATGQDLHGKSVVIEDGRIVGTPAYMSPEQAAGQISAISTLSDVYSLGVLLYELLAGVLPFDQESLESMARREILRIIREVPAPSPSTKLSSVDEQRAAYIANARQCAKRRLSEDLRRELEWIPLKALRKEPDRRYASAASLAADVRRYLEGAALEAAPDSRGYATRKFIGRHRLQFAAGISIVMLLILAVIGTSYGMTRAREALAQAEKDRQSAEFDSYRANIIAADASLNSLNNPRARDRLNRCQLDDQRNWEWRWLQARIDTSILLMIGHAARVNAVAFSADGARLVTASDDHTAIIWNVADGTKILTLRGHRASLTDAKFSPNGLFVATISSDGSARLWDTRNGNERFLIDSGASVLSASFDSASTRLLTTSSDSEIRILDIETGREQSKFRELDVEFTSAFFSADNTKVVAISESDRLAIVWSVHDAALIFRIPFDGGQIHSTMFNPTSDRLITASHDGTSAIWNTLTGEKVSEIDHKTCVHLATLSANSNRSISASGDGAVRVWDPNTGAATAVLAERLVVDDVGLNHDGRLAITSSGAGTIKVWDTASGRLLSTLCGHEKPAEHIAFSPDGSRIATASEDGTCRIWDTQLRDSSHVIEDVHTFMLSEDGGSLLCTGVRSELGFSAWDLVTGKRTLVSPLFEKSDASAWSRQGNRVAFTFNNRSMLCIRDVRRAHDVIIQLQEGVIPYSITFSPDGKKLLLKGSDEPYIIDADDGRLLATLQGHTEWVRTAHFSPDSNRVVTASDDNFVRTWDANTGRVIATWVASKHKVNAAIFNTDSTHIITMSDDGDSRLWNAASGFEVRRFPGCGLPALGASFSNDGTSIATWYADHSLRSWRVADGRLIAEYNGHEDRITSVEFSRDNRRLITASFDKSARIWDTKTGKEVALLIGHTDQVLSARMSSDGRRVSTISSDNTLRIWHSTPYRERFPAIQAAREAETRARVAINARIAAGETVQAIRDHAIADSSLADVDRTAYLIVTCELLEAQSHAAP